MGQNAGNYIIIIWEYLGQVMLYIYWVFIVIVNILDFCILEFIRINKYIIYYFINKLNKLIK